MKKTLERVNKILLSLDKAHLEWLCLIVMFVILLPVIILGKGAVFPILDQLDETILNYVFPAKYSGAEVYEQMMCGVPSTSLKPFAPGFVLLFKLFSPFTAFLLMYAIVVIVAGMGTYLCVKKLTGSSIIALLCGAVFALLPFRSIYGNSLAGTPLLVGCIICLKEGLNSISNRKKSTLTLPILGIAFYALTSSLVLVGYATIIVLFIFFVADWIISKKADKALIITGVMLVVIYALLNLDLISQLFFGGEFVSHREEYVISGFNFWGTFKGIMVNGMQHYDSFHKFIYIAIIVALPYAIYDVFKKGRIGKIYFVTVILMVVTGLLYAFFASDFVAEFRNGMTGMLKTFQFQRFYWLLVGGWYILLGVSLGVIWDFHKKAMGQRLLPVGMLFIFFCYIPTLVYVAKNPDCIFYQNINQINNGSDITGYISWESLYSEDVMKKIDRAINYEKINYEFSDTGSIRDKSEYRVAHIAMSPIPSLMYGFYTVDGYSNDYPLEYKKKFAGIIEKELSKNEMCSDYFYKWGNRCYLFYSEFGGAYMLGKTDATIEGMEFNLDKLRDLDCEYIFSGCEITDYEAQGLEFVGKFEDDKAFFRIYVYSL